MISMMNVMDLLITVAHAASAPPNIPIPSSCFPFFDPAASTPPAAGAGFTCAEEYISGLTFIVIGFAASIALIMLMVNGIRYMTGPATPGGSSDAAKKGIQMALVGLAVCLLTYVILDTFIQAITL